MHGSPWEGEIEYITLLDWRWVRMGTERIRSGQEGQRERGRKRLKDGRRERVREGEGRKGF